VWGAMVFMALALESVPAFLAMSYGRPGKSILYLATLPILWLIALDLASGHALFISIALVVAYPLPWIFLLRVMNQRREQLRVAEQAGTSTTA
jgi:hypothetical protein